MRVVPAMKTIYKYEIGFPRSVILLPAACTILSCQIQRGTIFVWAEVNPDEPDVEVEFECFGTGHSLPPDHHEYLTYLNTVQDGPLVWHVYIKLRLGMRLAKSSLA
jgi:hypothetical protein